MKKATLSLCGLLCLVGAYSLTDAQTRVGILFGPSVPSLSGSSNELTQGYVSRLALQFGVTYERDLSESFSIQPEILFDGQGGQRNGLQPVTSSPLPPLSSGGYYYADFKNSSILNYLEVPVLLRYRFGGQFQVNAGPYFGYLLSATQKTSGTSLIYVDKNRTPLSIPVPPDYTQTVQAPPQSFNASTDVMDSIHRFNAGIEAGVGVSVPVANAQSLSLEVHGLYGMTNIQKYAADGTNRTGNLLISVGYSFLLAGTQ